MKNMPTAIRCDTDNACKPSGPTRPDSPNRIA